MDRRYIIAGLFFFASVILAVVLVYPKYQVVQISSRLVEEKANEFEAQMVLVQEISRLRSQQKQMTEEIAHMEDLLPTLTKKSVADLFIELESIAAESGLLLDTISFAEEKEQAQKAGQKQASAKMYKTISAQLRMQGEYRDLKNFVRIIEKNKHLMDIMNVSISTASSVGEAQKSGTTSEKSQTITVLPSFAIMIRAYYQ